MNTKDILEQLARKEITPEVAKQRLKAVLQGETKKEIPITPPTSLDVNLVYRYVIQVLARMLKFEEKHIQIQDTPTNLGIDSISSVRLIEEFEKNLGPLPKTLFFEHPTFQDIAHFLLETYPEKLTALLCKTPLPPTPPRASPPKPVPVSIPQAVTPAPLDFKKAIFATPSWQNGSTNESQDAGAKILIYPSSYAKQLDKTRLLDGIQETIELPVYTGPEDVLKGFKQIAEIAQRLMKQKTYPKATFFAIIKEEEYWKYSYLHGFLLSLALERPAFRVKIVKATNLDHDLSQEWALPDQVIYYQDQKRYVLRQKAVIPDQEMPLVKEGGVYWITGGGGGLGRLFANYFTLQKKNITLILSGRQNLTDKQIQAWNLPKSPHVQWIYRSCDVANPESIQKTLEFIQHYYGNLNGILHSAGVIKDSFLITKNLDLVDTVFAPKVKGAIYLDEATKNMPLDYFVLFSSESGAFGNIGQTDYSAFNAFMDSFAAHRENLKLQKKRSGKTLAVNWPLWKEGGMSVPPSVEKELFDVAGMIPMTTPLGVQSLSKMLAMPYSQVMIAEGDVERISRFHHILPSNTPELIPYNRILQESTTTLELDSDLIAIVGMSCRFPGNVSTPQEYWNLLTDHRDVLIPPPAERWDHSLYYDPNPNQPNTMYLEKGAFLHRSVRSFDSSFFNISSREADEIDPQHRYLLELSWEALENAGIVPKDLQGTSMGVFVGIIASEYTSLNRDLYDVSPYLLTGSLPHMASGRIGYIYNTHGPAISIDTACSSSLTACHLACQSLKSKECNLALVGGINLMLNPNALVGLCKLHALSPDGLCKPFDKNADGYGRSEGGGFVVLKRLSDAVKDGDYVHAVIKGSAVNHDGKSQGLTIPNCQAQMDVMRKALENAKIEAKDVQFIEAHGTGTPAGDPIEIRAIQGVYEGRSFENPLVIGSSKANIGHSEAGAGIASLIKMVQCLNYKTIPAHLHLTQVNPTLNLKAIPAYFPKANELWKTKDAPRIVATNSFGFSGTNVHMLLQEWENKKLAVPSLSTCFLPISAKTPKALMQYVKNYITYLKNETLDIREISRSMCLNRSHFKYRAVITGNTKEELLGKLQNFTIEEQKPSSIPVLFGNEQMFATHPSYKNAIEKNWQPFLEHFMLPIHDAIKNPTTPAMSRAITVCSQIAFVSFLQEIGFSTLVVHGVGVGALTAKYLKGNFPIEALVMHIQQWDVLPEVETEIEFAPNTMDLRSSDPDQILKSAILAYSQGNTIQWKLLLGNVSDKSIKLPTYPFEEHSHWFPENTQTGQKNNSSEHPLRGDPVLSPSPIYQHEFFITEHKLPEIQDTHGLLHVGQIMEMFHSMLKSAWKLTPDQFTLHDLTFHRGLLISKALSIYGTLDGETLSLYTFDQEWLLHVSARVEKGSNSFTLPILEQKSTQKQTGTEFEAFLQEKGLHLGPSVLLVKDVEHYPTHIEVMLKGDKIQRGLFDAIAQSYHLFLSPEEATTTLLVESFGKISFLHPDAKGPFRAIVTSDSFYLFDGKDRMVVACLGCKMKKLQLQKVELSQEQQDLIYNLQICESLDEKKAFLNSFVAGLLQALLKQSISIDPEQSLYDIGFDSIVGIDLRNAIQKALKIEIDMNQLFANPTLSCIVSMLVGNVKMASIHPWLRGNLDDHETPRLYCFPYGAGGASVYREWQEKLFPYYNVISIQLPGREDRIDEEPISNMQELLTTLESILKPHLHIPFAFYGHSLGALIAYLLTHILDQKPEHLFVGAFSAPLRENPWLQKIKAKFPNLEESYNAKAILEFFSSKEASPEHLERAIPLFLADVRLVESAKIPQNTISVPITAFGGINDDRVAPSEIEEWSALTSNSFQVHILEGDHFFIHENKEDVLRNIQETVCYSTN